MGQRWDVPGRMVRVIDGDTLVIDLDLGWHTWRLAEPVRLEGLNTPEVSTPEGRAVRDLLREQLPAGTEVRVSSRKLDKYGRVLGRVFTPIHMDVGNWLLAQGFAVPMEG